MRLKMGDLQSVVDKVMQEDKRLDALREEVKRVLGPRVGTDGNLIDIVEDANAAIDVMEHTGRINRVDFSPNVVKPFLKHNDERVRRFAARTAPAASLGSLYSDRSPMVRSVLASRGDLKAVKEMMKRFPKDDNIKVVYKKRVIAESGIPQPKAVKEPFDIHGDKRLGDAAKQPPVPELSEQWYKDKAFNLMQDYGANLEYTWEEQAARQFARHTKATSGVEIDEAKLLKAIKDMIEEKEDRALERDALKETLSWLDGLDTGELTEGGIPHARTMQEVNDPVRVVLEGNLTPEQFIEQVNTLFNVQHSTLPPGIKKHRLGEGTSHEVRIPIIAMMPSETDTELCEKALDTYVKHWNKRQAFVGEPLIIDWQHHGELRKVGFSVTLK